MRAAESPDGDGLGSRRQSVGKPVQPRVLEYGRYLSADLRLWYAVKNTAFTVDRPRRKAAVATISSKSAAMGHERLNG